MLRVIFEGRHFPFFLSTPFNFPFYPAKKKIFFLDELLLLHLYSSLGGKKY